MQPSATDPTYVGLARQATDIFLRDVPEITLAEERHVVTFNNTYWTGWMSAGRPVCGPVQPVGSHRARLPEGAARPGSMTLAPGCV